MFEAFECKFQFPIPSRQLMLKKYLFQIKSSSFVYIELNFGSARITRISNAVEI